MTDLLSGILEGKCQNYNKIERQGTQTVLIFATVFERIEIKTIICFREGKKMCDKGISLLVNNNVFDSAAKQVMSIGPNIGWKLVASAKLRDVLPNQICTISQAMALTVHCLCLAGLSPARR